MWFSPWLRRPPVIDAQPDTTTSQLPPHVTSSIARAVQNAVAHLPGVWTVDVQPTRERGRWRMEMRGPLGRHVWTCLAPADRLAEVIDAKVRRFVRVGSTHYQIRLLAQGTAARSATRKAPLKQ